MKILVYRMFTANIPFGEIKVSTFIKIGMIMVFAIELLKIVVWWTVFLCFSHHTRSKYKKMKMKKTTTTTTTTTATTTTTKIHLNLHYVQSDLGKR